MTKSKTIKLERPTRDGTALFADAVGETPYAIEDSIKSFADWLLYVEEKPLFRPSVPTPTEWTQLSIQARNTSRTNRSNYNAAFEPILTPSRTSIRDAIIRLITVNRKSRDSARMSAVIRGLPTVGKTTLVKYIGQSYHRACCDLHKNLYSQAHTVPATQRPFIPVVYISLRGLKNREVVSISAFLKKLARFYGIPHDARKQSEDDLIEAIIETACKCKTSLVIIDEISNIDLRFVGAKTISDTIKDLMNHIPATFVFAGIDVDAMGIFVGYDDQNYEEDTVEQKSRRRIVKKPNISTASQMFHRLADYEMLPFNNKLQKEAEAIIGVLDKEIALVHHKRGDLLALFPYIMQRTDGFIGAMISLIRQGCEAAIALEGKGELMEERLTEALLETIKIDLAAETAYAKVKKIRKEKLETKAA